MSAESHSPAELRRLDKDTARNTLTVAEFERWEQLKDLHEQAEQQRQEWAENEQAATDILVNADMSSVASEVDLFGNECSVYYDPEDQRIRDAAQQLGDVLGVDIEHVDEIEASAEDIDDDKIDDCKTALADFIGLTLETWNGDEWRELPVSERDYIKNRITNPYPDGWGLSGLMDAMSEIMVAVESARDDRLERVEKFRNPERRGDR